MDPRNDAVVLTRVTVCFVFGVLLVFLVVVFLAFEVIVVGNVVTVVAGIGARTAVRVIFLFDGAVLTGVTRAHVARRAFMIKAATRNAIFM